ncbi:MAG: DUF4954 family protein [Prevotella sp.]|nr:DUF4954 family protein [Prevotella sp.]MCM1075337.1 DUF4954 family protein [Ruminococcus sp.]
MQPYRSLTPAEITQLKGQACYCPDWSNVYIREGIDLRMVRSTRFAGTVKIGMLQADTDVEQGIYSAMIKDCVIGDNVFICGVAGRLEGLVIDDMARIENVGRILAEPEADYGVGTAVSVLDETGSRPVYIFPGLTAQLAWLMAHRPAWTEDTFLPMLEEIRERSPRVPTIGKGAVVQDTRYIFNVRIGAGVRVLGASYLKNGTIISNGTYDHSLTLVGNDVDAEDFIVEDAHVDSGTLLRRCYVGQGVELEKRFTAHDSLFFANCSMENGEACAIMAGPYTVSMHKSSLLIGGEYSFFNAGSGTNSSNHKYKLGPVHWGVMQRGVKCASSSYIMWGGRVGAFSLLMGAHKLHPDTASFPFSYLFGQSDGSTLVMPGLMLKSCGLMRDELKWPKRDRRVKGRVPLHDNINFEVLNPITVGAMIDALHILDELKQADVNSSWQVRYKNVYLRAKDLERGIEFYTLAIAKYVFGKLKKAKEEGIEAAPQSVEWRDLGGQILPLSVMENAMEADSLEEITAILKQAHEQFAATELAWIYSVLDKPLKEVISKAENAAARLDALVEQDRKDYLKTLSTHNSAFTL